MATDADATTLSPNAFSKEAENQTVNTANSRAKKTKEQSALAFSKEILGKINDNNAVTKGEGITVKEFLRQAEGYKEYRAYFSAHPEFVVKLVSESPVEAVVDIKGLVSNSPELVAAVEPVPEGAGNLTQFKQADEKLDQSTPIEVVSGAVRDKAWEETISTVQQIRQKTDTKVVRFFKILEEKKVYGTKEELEAAKREIDKPITQLTPDEARAEISRRLQKTGAANEQEAQRAAAEYCEETGLDRDFAAIAQSIDVVAKNPEITTPNIIFESIARGDKAEDAIRLSRMATVVNAPESFIKQPIARMNSAFVDAARTVFPGVTQTTITDVVARTWEGATKAEGFVEEMTRRGVNKEALDSLVME